MEARRPLHCSFHSSKIYAQVVQIQNQLKRQQSSDAKLVLSESNMIAIALLQTTASNAVGNNVPPDSASSAKCTIAWTLHVYIASQTKSSWTTLCQLYWWSQQKQDAVALQALRRNLMLQLMDCSALQRKRASSLLFVLCTLLWWLWRWQTTARLQCDCNMLFVVFSYDLHSAEESMTFCWLNCKESQKNTACQEKYSQAKELHGASWLFWNSFLYAWKWCKDCKLCSFHKLSSYGFSALTVCTAHCKDPDAKIAFHKEPDAAQHSTAQYSTALAELHGLTVRS